MAERVCDCCKVKIDGDAYGPPGSWTNRNGPFVCGVCWVRFRNSSVYRAATPDLDEVHRAFRGWIDARIREASQGELFPGVCS